MASRQLWCLAHGNRTLTLGAGFEGRIMGTEYTLELAEKQSERVLHARGRAKSGGTRSWTVFQVEELWLSEDGQFKETYDVDSVSTLVLLELAFHKVSQPILEGFDGEPTILRQFPSGKRRWVLVGLRPGETLRVQPSDSEPPRYLVLDGSAPVLLSESEFRDLGRGPIRVRGLE